MFINFKRFLGEEIKHVDIQVIKDGYWYMLKQIYKEESGIWLIFFIMFTTAIWPWFYFKVKMNKRLYPEEFI